MADKNEEKIRKELDWQPQETFSSGILKTLSKYAKTAIC